MLQEMTQTNEYQAYQPFKKKKSCQQNKIAAFRQSYGVGAKFSQFELNLVKHGKIQIYKIMKLTLDIRAKRGVTVLTSGSWRSV